WKSAIIYAINRGVNMTKEPQVAPDTQEVLEKYDKDATTRQFEHKSIFWIVTIVAVLYSLFHLYMVFNPMPALQQRSIHVAVGLALVYMLYPMFKTQNRAKLPILDWILAALSLYTAIYIFTEYQAIVTERGGIPNNMDIAMAILSVALILEAARRVTGLILPILALLFLIYPFFSHMEFLPNMMMTRPYSVGDIFGQLYLSTEGLYSTAIAASVNFIFLFILFGAFLQI